MADLFAKLYCAGVGALSLTLEKIDTIAAYLVDKGSITLKEISGLPTAMLERGEQVRAELQAAVKKEAQRVFAALDLPTREEIQNLQRRLNTLEQEKR